MYTFLFSHCYTVGVSIHVNHSFVSVSLLSGSSSPVSSPVSSCEIPIVDEDTANAVRALLDTEDAAVWTSASSSKTPTYPIGEVCDMRLSDGSLTGTNFVGFLFAQC